jgi:hypothetical protein
VNIKDKEQLERVPKSLSRISFSIKCKKICLKTPGRSSISKIWSTRLPTHTTKLPNNSKKKRKKQKKVIKNSSRPLNAAPA